MRCELNETNTHKLIDLSNKTNLSVNNIINRIVESLNAKEIEKIIIYHVSQNINGKVKRNIIRKISLSRYRL